MTLNRDLSAELKFKTSRSSGSGGQNVNKVSTKVELIFHPGESSFFTPEEKAMLLEKLAGRIRSDGAIHIVSQEARTQKGNKEKVTDKLMAMLEKALTPVKKRKIKRVSRSEKEKRLEAKKQTTRKKELRRKPGMPPQG